MMGAHAGAAARVNLSNYPLSILGDPGALRGDFAVEPGPAPFLSFTLDREPPIDASHSTPSNGAEPGGVSGAGNDRGSHDRGSARQSERMREWVTLCGKQD
jgi:hypothetical protein